MGCCRKNNLGVSSKFKLLAFKFEFPTSTTRITIVKDIADEGAVNWKSMRKIGNKILYITPKGGIKELSAASRH